MTDAIPATKFDRLADLPARDRMAFSLIVGGDGHVLVDQQRQRAAKNGPAAQPASPLARRYLDGARLLAALHSDEPTSAATTPAPQPRGTTADNEAGGTPAESEAPAAKASIVVLTSPTARTLTIVFSGNNTEFALPAHLLTHHDTHLVLIHDRRRCFALAGIPGLGADYATCATNLRRIVTCLRAERVVVLGISAGGAGALKFACDLAVHRLLCFSVPTTLRLEDDPGAPMARYPQLARLYRENPDLGIDLAAYYAAHPKPPQTMLVYSPGHLRDAWLALRMNGLAGVTLRPTLEYDGHTTYRWLILQGRLGEYLNWLYESHEPVSASARLAVA